MTRLGVTVAAEDARSLLRVVDESNQGCNADTFIQTVMSKKKMEKEGGLVGVRFQSEIAQPDDPILDPYGNRLRTKFTGGTRSKIPRRDACESTEHHLVYHAEAAKSLKQKIKARVPADSKQARTFLNHIYKRYDADYDGKITRTEFEQGLTMIGVRATFDEVNSLMTDLDKNDDGVISFDELSVVIGIFTIFINTISCFLLFSCNNFLFPL